MIPFKIVKTRLLIGLLLFLGVWLTYQYMESLFSQPYIHKNHIGQMGAGKKVTVTVFYECLCPDSKSFILNHLLPSYERAPHLLSLEMIPYGKAETRKTDEGYEFECQHGAQECMGNKIHACVLAKVKDEMRSIRMVACLLDDNGVSVNSVGTQCSGKFGVDWALIMECAKGAEGSLLLKVHGESTDYLSPKISFVPTILLNHQRDGQPAILKNLWKEICRLLPENTPQCQ